jgi:hypothetical protein
MLSEKRATKQANKNFLDHKRDLCFPLAASAFPDSEGRGIHDDL